MLAQIDLQQGVETAWTDLVAFVPRFIGFLAILLIGYVVAKMIGKIADRMLERFGFDKAVERGGVKKALAKSKYDASDLVGKVVFYTLFLFVLQLAFGVFGSNPVSDLLAGVVAFLPKLFVALVIVVVAGAIAAGVKELVSSSLGGLSWGQTAANVAAGAIVVIGAFAALNQVEVAPEIVNGLFYGALAVICGSAIIAIGGGGIKPMQQKWTKALQKVEQEAGAAKTEIQTLKLEEEQRSMAGGGRSTR